MLLETRILVHTIQSQHAVRGNSVNARERYASGLAKVGYFRLFVSKNLNLEKSKI